MTSAASSESWGESVFQAGRGTEEQRLALIAEILDRGTRAVLDRIGIGDGWRCLEIGAGSGSLLPYLAERAGPTGHVVATELSQDLVGARGETIEVIQHDITQDPRPGEPFDLIHARAVLEHLPSRQDVLERIATWLTPNGVLLVEVVSMVSDASTVSDYQRVLAKAIRVLGEKIGTDLNWARQMPLPLAHAGLSALEVESRGVVIRGATPSSVVMDLTFGQLHGADLLSDDDIETVRRLLADPSFVDHSLSIIAAWGTRELQVPGAEV